jgi:cell division protein FtsQ
MARKSGSTILQEELYPPSVETAREEIDDARLVDLDVDEESPFLRGQKRVSARRSSLPKKTANRLLWAVVAASILCVAGLGAAWLYHYGEHSWRFRVESSDNIEVTGMQNVTKAQIMEVMGADIGRNIFFIPLAQQKAQLEQVPWVESASVMRFVPNRLKVEIHERTPVAFARVGPRMSLIDAGGTLMELTPKHRYSFPVILGMNPGEPLSTRSPRMKIYAEMVNDLDSGGAHYSQDLSEVDISDLDDVKVRVNDPAGDVLVHLGSSDYLRRYKIYVSHAQGWRQQFQKLESVDLRYDNQIIVNPDSHATPPPPTMPASLVKASTAEGVKRAMMVQRDRVERKPLIGPVQVPSAKTASKSVKIRKKAARHRKVALRRAKAQVKAAPESVAKTQIPGTAGAPKNAAVTPPTQGNTTTKTGNKPSPAIPKGQEQ